jgi:molybdopterin-guanine dinucleotide biosynthesis protein A
MNPNDVTGLILAGGRGSRMGGIDKGLQAYRGLPLTRHVLERLAPQVGPMMISANRHLDTYRSFGVPVWPDANADFDGPLAGLMAGLAHCETPYLASVPCDAPDFPEDLVARLAAGLRTEGADIAVARTPAAGDEHGLQPVFCLVRATLLDNLTGFVREGGRKVGRWIAAHRCARVDFEDAHAFFNANTLVELQQLEARHV